MQTAPIKPLIGIEDLERADIRVGTIRRAESVPKSRKFVKLTVHFGDHDRSILGGLQGERADPGPGHARVVRTRQFSGRMIEHCRLLRIAESLDRFSDPSEPVDHRVNVHVSIG